MTNKNCYAKPANDYRISSQKRSVETKCDARAKNIPNMAKEEKGRKPGLDKPLSLAENPPLSSHTEIIRFDVESNTKMLIA